MAGKIPQHSHCQMCGKAVPVDETLCSEECKDKYQTMVKRRKILVYIMYGLMALIVAFFIGSSL